MSGPDLTLTGAMDDVCGAGIGVYQDHDKVRVDIGGAERLLDMAGLSKFMTLLRDAALDARLWDLERDHAADPCPVCGAPDTRDCDPAVLGPIEDNRHV